LQQPDYDDGKGDNENITALLNHLFINHMDSLTLYEKVAAAQENDASTVQSWAKANNLESNNHHWFKDGCLVVVENNELRRGIMHTYHDTPTAGHARVSTTLFSISRDYWWPNMKHFVTAYIKGCATCQANKANTRPNKPPLFPITPKHDALPFQTITVDWITKLPESQGYDSIMTVTDHDCSKAMVFIPCKETDGTEKMVELYTQHVVPHYGIPTKIISDHDPRLTAELFKELCNVFGVRRNMSMAYHPQTDGQSERTNQTLETFLQIFCNYQQNDWAKLLPVAQYALNARQLTTMKKAPFEALIGYIPSVHQHTALTRFQNVEDRLSAIKVIRREAQSHMKHAQDLLIKTNVFKPYTLGQRVWLEATNLRTTHPTAKLQPKQYGPFTMTRVISHVAYQLDLPPQWKIHNVFHATYLSPYKETEEHGLNFPEPPPELIKGEKEYEVEHIVDMRHFGRNKKLQYKVQ
jgi:phosphohistidine phosphatase SixA